MKIGDIDVRRGDGLRALARMADESIDLLLTDPPYGTTDCHWDEPVDWPRFWAIARRKLKPRGLVVMFAAGKFTFTLWATNPKWFRYDLIWKKTRPVGFLDANRKPLRAHESILIFAPRLAGAHYIPQKGAATKPPRLLRKSGKQPALYGKQCEWSQIVDGSRHPTSVLDFAKPHNSHPAEKPVALLEWLVRSYSHPGDLIVDPFLGSGTTAHASVTQGRRCIGIERDPIYFRSAVKRVREAIRAAAAAAPASEAA